MPRALSDQERDRQRRYLLSKGRALIFSRGLRRISVDDVAQAAGVAKGTFYLYFASKDAYLLASVQDFIQEYFENAANVILGGPREDLPKRLRVFLRNLFELPESVFFFKNHADLEAILQSANDDVIRSIHDLELRSYTRLLELAGIDTARVRPGVVHNLLHAIYQARGEELMMKADLPETFEVMLDGLMRYLFGGEAA